MLSIVFEVYFCSSILDLLEEELFKAKERMIEISISYDHLYDSVSGLERQLHESRKCLRKLQKQYNSLKKVHSHCNSRNRILYR